MGWVHTFSLLHTQTWSWHFAVERKSRKRWGPKRYPRLTHRSKAGKSSQEDSPHPSGYLVYLGPSCLLHLWTVGKFYTVDKCTCQKSKVFCTQDTWSSVQLWALTKCINESGKFWMFWTWLGTRQYYQTIKHLKCLMSVQLLNFPWFHYSTFLLETQKAKIWRCLIEHKNIWEKEVEKQSWILKASSAGVIFGGMVFCQDLQNAKYRRHHYIVHSKCPPWTDPLLTSREIIKFGQRRASRLSVQLCRVW